MSVAHKSQKKKFIFCGMDSEISIEMETKLTMLDQHIVYCLLFVNKISEEIVKGQWRVFQFY